MMLQILATMFFTATLLAGVGVIGSALAREADAIRRALGLDGQPVVVPPLPPRYRVLGSRRLAPVAVRTQGWREAA